MGLEASKTKKFLGEQLLQYLKGDGIDIGCGPDPILPHVKPFDQEHGDANQISRFVKQEFDFIFSSHCLEHLKDPEAALLDWLKILKPGGHLIGIVPDEDLYEQGFFPSKFNADHRHTFRLNSSMSWSPVSIHLTNLLKKLPDTRLIRLEQQSHGIHRPYLRKNNSRFLIGLRLRLGRITLKLANRFTAFEKTIVAIFGSLGAIFDQTALPSTRHAQLYFVLQKSHPKK